MKIKFLAAGGTIDKIYFDQKSEYEVGEPTIIDILKHANIDFEYETESILRKDSLDMTDTDRQLIFDRVQADPNQKIVLTHGTDTMVQTAQKLISISGKTIVLTGSMQPARFQVTDATFNVGCAIGAVQSLPHGVYVVMNGHVFTPNNVKKNVKMNRFEEV